MLDFTGGVAAQDVWKITELLDGVNYNDIYVIFTHSITTPTQKDLQWGSERIVRKRFHGCIMIKSSGIRYAATASIPPAYKPTGQPPMRQPSSIPYDALSAE